MDSVTTPIKMYVVPSVEIKGNIVKIRDYSKSTKKPAQFVGLVTTLGHIIHLPLDRGETIAKLARDVMNVWTKNISEEARSAQIKGLFFEANVAVMVTEKDGVKTYRFYDAADPKTFEKSPHTNAPRERVDLNESFMI